MEPTSIESQIIGIALTVAAAMIPILLPLLTTKIAALLKVSTDDARYQSLYRTIDYVLRALIAKAPGGAAALQGVPGDLVQQAVEQVKANNPHVAKLGESDEALKTKVIAKLPDAQAAVAAAQATVRDSAPSRPLA